MSTHSVAEAMDKSEELVDRALGGEEILIEREGQLVELKPIQSARPDRPNQNDDVDQLTKHPADPSRY